jgi:hypothetical protein
MALDVTYTQGESELSILSKLLLGFDQGGFGALGTQALMVDGSAVIQPISGSVGILGTVPISGSVSVIGETFVAGALKVDGSAVTQPVSIAGTVTVTGVENIHPVIQTNPTISTSAYSIGFSIGGIQILANAVGVKGTGILDSLSIFDNSNQGKKMDVYIFNASPAVAATTDHAAFLFNTDGFKCIGRIPIALADWGSLDATKTMCLKTGLGITVKAAAGTSLFAVAVLGATATYAALALQFTYGFEQD